MTESLLALSMESKEWARVSAMVYVALIVLISPFGMIISGNGFTTKYQRTNIYFRTRASVSSSRIRMRS